MAWVPRRSPGTRKWCRCLSGIFHKDHSHNVRKDVSFVLVGLARRYEDSVALSELDHLSVEVDLQFSFENITDMAP